MSLKDDWIPDPNFGEAKRGQPYILENGKKMPVNMLRLIRDTKLGISSIALDQVIVPVNIGPCIQQAGEILVGTSPDTCYLASIRQELCLRCEKMHVSLSLRKTVPTAFTTSIKEFTCHYPLRKAAFTMSRGNHLAAFLVCGDTSDSYCFIYSVNNRLKIAVKLEYIDYDDTPMTRFLSSTETTVAINFPVDADICKKTVKPVFIIIAEKLPEDVVETASCKILKIGSRFCAGSWCAPEIGVCRKGIELPYYRVKNVATDFFVVRYSPTIEVAVLEKAAKAYPIFKDAKVIDFVGDMITFNDQYCDFAFRGLLRVNNHKVFTCGIIRVLLITHAKQGDNYNYRNLSMWVKKMNATYVKGIETFNTIPYNLPKTMPEGFDSTFFYADLEKNESVTSFMPHQGGGVEYTFSEEDESPSETKLQGVDDDQDGLQDDDD